MNLTDLDQQQKKVIEAVIGTEANILVLGGAGSGKTTTALWAARHYLEAQTSVTAPRVLFLTFSRSAVSQIISGAPGVLSNYKEQVEILTFHSLCYRFLKAFGRYSGYGTGPIRVQSESRRKLLGKEGNQLLYDDLIEGATAILARSPNIRDLVACRWGLVICDEVQDTSELQWELVKSIAREKLLLLGDPHQMIYSTFVRGVSHQQFQRVRDSADQEISLLPQSHRDPSGNIPSLAEAVRIRHFEHNAVVDAIKCGRLLIHFGIDGDSHKELLSSEITKSRASGSRDIGIFAHSNAGVAEIAEMLNSVGVDHALVGIPEAHVEALGSMAIQCAYAIGMADEAQFRESLALFLTACVRGSKAPDLAQALIGRGPLPEQVEGALLDLEKKLRDASNGRMAGLMEVATDSWKSLRMTSGNRPWHRAAQHFNRLSAHLRDVQVDSRVLNLLNESVEKSRIDALLDLDYSEQSRVKLMTYHQTKSREADTVIHLYSNSDFFGRESEPFEAASRLLYVALTRARKRLVVILPSEPHPLVEPFNSLREIQDSVLTNC